MFQFHFLPRVMVVCDWKSKKPCLRRKFSLFKMSWQMLDVLLECNLAFPQFYGWSHQNSWLCLFQYLFGPSERLKKKTVTVLTTKNTTFGIKSKKSNLYVLFFQKILLFLLLSFVMRYITSFLPIKFPSKSTFILWPLTPKIVIKRGFFWYLWTAKDHIHLRSFLGNLEVF